MKRPGFAVVFACLVAITSACSEDSTSPSCMPVCGHSECGADGCGGVCGTCGANSTCSSTGVCEPNCVPRCDGRECGADGCGGVCGTCGADSTCSSSGVCEPNCVPRCDGRECGDDGCGGVCGTCADDAFCSRQFVCKPFDPACVPDCDGRECGSDDCGGSCGDCGELACGVDGICQFYQLAGRILYEEQTIVLDEQPLVADSQTGASTATYKKPTFGDIVERPAPGMLVTLFDASGESWLGQTETLDDGSFQMEVERAPLPSDVLYVMPVWMPRNEPLVAVVRTEKQQIAQDWYTGDVWTWSVPIDDYLMDDQDAMHDIVISVDEGSGAIHLLKTVKKLYQGMLDNAFVSSELAFPSMAIVWKPGQSWSCGTCYRRSRSISISDVYTLSKTIEVDGTLGNGSAWETVTVMHEFGHMIMGQRRDDTPGGSHSIRSASDPRLAWSEGWAHFYCEYAQSVEAGRYVSDYWRLMGSNAKSVTYWLDFDAIHERDMVLFNKDALKPGVVEWPDPKADHPMLQNLSEGYVAWMLLQLWDGSEFDDTGSLADPLNIPITDFWTALKSDRFKSEERYNAGDSEQTTKRHGEGVELVDFLDALACQELVNASELAQWLDSVEAFPYDGKPVCSIQ